MTTLTSGNPLQERLLVSRAQAGDTAAFRALVHHYDQRLFYFIRRFVRDEHRAADVMQDVWLTVFAKLRRLRSPEAFRRWLYQIAHDRAVTQIRRSPPVTEALPADIADRDVESVQEFLSQERAAAVHAALDRLSEDHRSVIVLRFLEDLGLPEIAEILREPLGTIKSRLHYAKESLRRLLTEDLLHD